MLEEISLQRVLASRYSLARIQWLVGATSLVSLLYLSSEEIWRIFDSQPFPEVAAEGIMSYMAFFLAILMLAHYYDTKRIVRKSSVAVVASLISMAIDLCLLSFAELVVLYTIQVLPQDISKIAVLLLIGALPSSLGVVALSSLTAETLKKRAEELYKEVQKMGKQVEDLEKQRKKAMKNLKLFEKKKAEFENNFRKTRAENKEEDKDG